MSTTVRPRASMGTAAPRPARESRAARAVRAAGGLSNVTIAVIVALALGGLSVLYLIQTSQVVQLGYQLTHLQEERDALVLENSRLRYEIARYQSLDTIERMARDELGMVPVRRTLFLDVERPPQAEPVPAAGPATGTVSRWQRIWDVIWGVGWARDPEEQAPASGQGGG